VLSDAPFALACAHEHLDLHIAGRYAPPILALVRAAGTGRTAALNSMQRTQHATRRCNQQLCVLPEGAMQR
jgi:hypothetical protein